MTDNFDQWYWTTNTSSNSCQGTGGFKCVAPHACARGKSANKRYCCNARSDPYDCWTGGVACSNDGKTTECGSGTTRWCCLGGGKEMCTQIVGQINICWSTEYDTLKNVSLPALESAHSSLSAAAPISASSVPFDPLSLIALTAPPPSSTSSSSSTGAPATTTPTGSNPAPTNAANVPGLAGNGDGSSSSSSRSDLSAGVIAGIVIGCVAFLAIVAPAVFLLFRYKKNRRAAAAVAGGYGGVGEMQGSQATSPPQAPYSDHHHHHQQQNGGGYYPNGGGRYYPGSAVSGGTTYSPEVQGSAVSPSFYQEAYSKSLHGRTELNGAPTPVAELPPSHHGWTASELPVVNREDDKVLSAGASVRNGGGTL